MANIDASTTIVVQKIYKYNMCQIKVGSTLSLSFKTSKSLLQGCPMLLTLFNIYVEVNHRAWSWKCERMAVYRIERIYLYPSDQVITTQN